MRNDTIGRVVDDAGRVLAGEYVAGWIKRGPTGVIGTNKGDAAETVHALLDDLAAGALDGSRAVADIDQLLEERGVEVVPYAGWLAIDAEELARGATAGRPRVKVNRWDDLHTYGRAQP